MKIMFQTYYRAPVAPQIVRERFRATLPSEFQALVPSETVAKRAQRLINALPACLDSAWAQAGGGRTSGQQWSIIAVKSAVLDKSLGHVKAYSIRLTQSGAIVGDYERESTPVGDVFFTDEGKVQARGDLHIIEGVRSAAAETQDLLATKDILSIFRAGMYAMGAFDQGKTSWYVPQHTVDKTSGCDISVSNEVRLQAFVAAFKAIGCRAGISTVAVDVGDNVEDIVQAFSDFACQRIAKEIELVEEAKVEQAKYMNGERKRSLQTSTFDASGERLASVKEQAERLLTLIDTEHTVLSTMVEALKNDANEVLWTSRNISASVACDKTADWTDTTYDDETASKYTRTSDEEPAIEADPMFEEILFTTDEGVVTKEAADEEQESSAAEMAEELADFFDEF